MDEIRKAFEEITWPNFNIGHSLERRPNGEYVDANAKIDF